MHLDGIMALDLAKLPEAQSWHTEKFVFDDGTKLALLTVEIKTRVSASSLNEVIHIGDVYSSIEKWHSPRMRYVVPHDYLLQTLLTCTVLGTNTALYACAPETSLIYTSVVYVRGRQLL